MTRFRSNKKSVHGQNRRRRRNKSAKQFDIEVETEHFDINERRIVDILVPLIIGAILSRTHKGIDAEGKKFPPYHPQYAKDRTKSGLKSNPVDLRRTGQLLGSLGLRQVKLTQKGVQVVIQPDAHLLARAKSIEVGGRLFVGLSPADMASIAAQFSQRNIPIRVYST